MAKRVAKGKPTHRKRDTKSSAAVSKPTPAEPVHICNMPKPAPMELVRFCKEVGIDLFDIQLRSRIDQIKTKEDNSALVKELSYPRGRPASMEDKLRLALKYWTHTSQIAAGVIEEIDTPDEFAADPRFNFRWCLSTNLSIPQYMIDDAELWWEHAFVGLDSEEDTAEAFLRSAGGPRVVKQVTQRPISWEEAIRTAEKYKAKCELRAAPDFKTENGMRAAFLAFGCPERLMSGLTETAVEQLIWLANKWGKAQNKKHSGDKRHREKEKRQRKQGEGEVTEKSLSNSPAPLLKSTKPSKEALTQLKKLDQQDTRAQSAVRSAKRPKRSRPKAE